MARELGVIIEEKSNEYWIGLDRQYRIQSRYTAPLVLERGQGTRLWDVEGHEYIDFESGQVCVSTGHCHPKYVEALVRQANVLQQTGSNYTAVAQIELAKKLAEISPGPLQKSYFACTGSESNEAALRIAKVYTGSHEVASLLRGYHGLTMGSISMSGSGGHFRKGYGPTMPGVVFLPPPYCYRCLFNEEYPGCKLSCIRYAEEVLNRTTSGRPAAIFLELVMSGAGVIVVPPEWLQEIRRICTERGSLLVVDEAQTGIGRTGRWFGSDHYGVVPDVITLSKSLGGGVPLSAVITTAEIADEAVEKGYYQSASHSGDPLLCAVGLANIGIMEEEGLVENAAEMGSYLKEGFREIQRRYEIIGDVRGLGLLIGIEFVKDPASKEPSIEAASTVSVGCRQNGLLVGHRPIAEGSPGIGTPSVIRVVPPFILSQADADRALEVFEKATKQAQDTIGTRRWGS